MIPKASQRGGGQDLATHLLNAHDNEYVEVAEVSGAVAPDLHGAFAEWEAIATGLTKCRNHLYSLSVNPDLGQGTLSRAQYLDYIERAEKKLGLEGQPRAVIFHIKEGREHCHVVWSRIDFFTEKAIHMAFDREKLMMVTREFARDHGLTLPGGYDRRSEDRPRPLSLYETQQERSTGLSKEERMVMVTHAWQQSDTPRAFVRALEELGYVLATGKRPYVLVDRYGTMNALPKLIDDRSVRTKDIRAFLAKEFPPEQLPTVEEARALVAQHRKVQEQFAKAQDDGKRREQLKATQERRRAATLAEQATLRERQGHEVTALAREQRAARGAARQTFVASLRREREARAAARPRGLAAFLGRVTGVTAIIDALHRRRDLQRYRDFRDGMATLVTAQRADALVLQRRHELQAAEVTRQLANLAKVDAREMRALEERRVREHRTAQRAGHDHMPALSLELKPRGRGASVRKAKNRYQDSLRTPEERLPREETPREPIDLRRAHEEALAADTPIRRPVDLKAVFTQAAEGDSDEGGDSGEATGGVSEKPVSRATRPSDRERRGRGRDEDFERER
ncbi:relaxase/mobilization nuclease domain-containing protein [Hyphomicrobium sp.]|uniref:relaxase/mobilization nuclease domain-containing protein n=1 Tax=Hyphomicrobium sp. TaxID=82 RepID=UPI003F71F1CE